MKQEEPNVSEAEPTEDVILCPVRGGKQSMKTVARAVELALSHEARLVFLYVVDVDFLGFATVARVKVMVDELTETGRFTLSILEDRARHRGVTRVESVIREGTIGQVIREVAGEIGATRLVLGRPVSTPGVLSFTSGAYNQLVQSLRSDLGLQVECVD